MPTLTKAWLPNKHQEQIMKTHSLWVGTSAPPTMVEDEDGKWVRKADAEKILVERDELLASLRTAVDIIKRLRESLTAAGTNGGIYPHNRIGYTDGWRDVFDSSCFPSCLECARLKERREALDQARAFCGGYDRGTPEEKIPTTEEGEFAKLTQMVANFMERLDKTLLGQAKLEAQNAKLKAELVEQRKVTMSQRASLDRDEAVKASLRQAITERDEIIKDCANERRKTAEERDKVYGELIAAESRLVGVRKNLRLYEEVVDAASDWCRPLAEQEIGSAYVNLANGRVCVNLANAVARLKKNLPG